MQRPASFVLAAILCLLPSVASAIDSGMREGQLFPDLRLPTLDGKYSAISSFRGKKVLLLVYASW
jgi:hypothetical protein